MSMIEIKKTDFDEVPDFYDWIRDYWMQLSSSPEGKLSYTLNFGLWSSPNVKNLYEAQGLFFDQIISLIGELSENALGLEIGSGIGGFAVRFAAAKRVHLSCIDIMKKHIAIAQQHAKQMGVDSLIDFQQGNAMSLPYEDNSFDFVYSIESSFHYPDKQQFFKEVYRVLKRDGVFVLADMTCEDNSLVTFKKGNYFPTSAEIQAVIEQAGFHIIKKIDIGNNVFEPLKNYLKGYNVGKRSKVAKYWELVLHNYAKLSKQHKMKYEIFQLSKP